MIARAVLLSLALAGPAAAQSVMLGPNALGDFQGRVRSVEELKFAGVIRQRFDFSCGSAALATLLTHHYGDAQSEASVFQGMWKDGDRAQIRKLGFSLLDMKRWLEARGLRANGFKVSLDEVAKAGVPGIALITLNGYRHFVVVKGVANGEVLVGDPALGLRSVPAAEFKSSWNGVYFILESATERGRRAFNARSDWSSYNRAPLGARFADPLSAAALALTAPFHRDF